MLINEIDFSELYRQQMALARHSEKTVAQWDQRAARLSALPTHETDDYLCQLIAHIDLRAASTLFDMGCGPGSLALALAPHLTRVYGVDYSHGMLEVAARRAQQAAIRNSVWLQRAWEDDWSDLPRCDIAVASRSTLPADLSPALLKLDRQAKLRVYTTHLVTPSFIAPQIQRAIGREVTELPTYIYALNLLYQQGIRAQVAFIRGPRRAAPASLDQLRQSVTWSLGALTPQEEVRLAEWYRQQPHTPALDACCGPRDWALLSWEVDHD
ncbi:class I SAM-dependent methyltransferase [Edwardsiella tarda]|uniref:class I SAM-dependent methyltransferase n=1 Tax=Edwardsiella tarda TaxID=636 RepID=UPI0030816304|nr:class I SAM-dependent methyltransferase [Edwardsiella tarda]